MALTLEEATKHREETIEANRALPIVEYDNGEKQSDQVWEVTEGLKHLPVKGSRRMTSLVPGMRFHPTEDQVRKTLSGPGGLRNKARELSRSEYAALRTPKRSVRGADIGLRSLKMEREALAAALEAELTEQDFEGVKGTGPAGRITLVQVEAVIEAKGGNQD